MALELTPQGYKRLVVAAKGPSSDTSVDATTAADITLSYQPGDYNTIVDVKGVRKVSGLPDGVVLVGFAASPDSVTVRVYNTTGGAVTIAANSVEAEVEAAGGRVVLARLREGRSTTNVISRIAEIYGNGNRNDNPPAGS